MDRWWVLESGAAVMTRKETVPARKRIATKSAPPRPNIMEPVRGGFLVRFERLQAGAFIGGDFPRIAVCACCGRTGALTFEAVDARWVCWHVAVLKLDQSNEPQLTEGQRCVWVERKPLHVHPALLHPRNRCDECGAAEEADDDAREAYERGYAAGKAVAGERSASR